MGFFSDWTLPVIIIIIVIVIANILKFSSDLWSRTNYCQISTKLGTKQHNGWRVLKSGQIKARSPNKGSLNYLVNWSKFLNSPQHFADFFTLSRLKAPRGLQWQWWWGCWYRKQIDFLLIHSLVKCLVCFQLLESNKAFFKQNTWTLT